MERGNDRLRIGPSGNSDAFYETGRKHTYQAAEWLSELSLDAFEYSFGRGVSMSDATAAKIRDEFSRYDIAVSAHAPYYTNFANTSDEMIASSVKYVLQSLDAVRKMGGNRVVVHPASCGKLSRDEAVRLCEQNLQLLVRAAHEAFDSVFPEWMICPETMGKMQQIGRVEEIIEFCKLDDGLYPCYDFGHINCYLQGGIRGKDDYRRIIDLTAQELGDKKARCMHVHFSKIEYGAGGEKKHLTFADDFFGPDYEPLAQLIDEYKLTPFIVCESHGTMSGDAQIMKNFHKND